MVTDFKVIISSYEDRIIEGRVENGAEGDPADFFGFLSLIEILQSRLDAGGGPDSTTALRQWDLNPGNTETKLPSSSEGRQGTPAARPLACFLIRVQFRQNASWQGTITWLEQRQSTAFRSVLELSRLVDRALQYACSRSRAAPVTRPAPKWTAKESVS